MSLTKFQSEIFRIVYYATTSTRESVFIGKGGYVEGGYVEGGGDSAYGR